MTPAVISAACAVCLRPAPLRPYAMVYPAGDVPPAAVGLVMYLCDDHVDALERGRGPYPVPKDGVS